MSCCDVSPTSIGSRTQCCEPGRGLSVAALQQPKAFSQDLARVLIPARSHQRIDELVLLLTENNIPCRHSNRPLLADYADLVLSEVFAFLASDDAAGINGQEVKVDAGPLSHQPMVTDMASLGATTV